MSAVLQLLILASFLIAINRSNAIPPTIMVLPNSTYSMNHVNLKWTLSPNFASFSFAFRTEESQQFTIIPVEGISTISELFQDLYSVSIIQSFLLGSNFQFKILIDTTNGLCEWTDIYSLPIHSKPVDSEHVNPETTMGANNFDERESYGLYGLGGVVTVGATTLALPVVGFTAGGIAAGSIAAGIQSSIGIVGGGTLFAAVQSAGMAGMATATQMVIGGIGAEITKGIMGWFDESDNNDQQKTKYNEQDNIENVKAWFDNNIDLREPYKEQYYTLLIDKGYDSIEIIKLLTEEELIKIGIEKPGHIKHILLQINQID